MHKNNRNRSNTRNHNTKYNVVHPQCRGYIHKMPFIQLATKPQFDLCTQLQIPSVLNSRAHSSRPLRTQLQIFPQSSYKTLYAHSCRGHPCTQLGLNLSYKTTLCFASIHLSSKILN